MITGIDVNAPVVVHRDIVIDAALSRVWTLLTDVVSWAEWHPDISAAAAASPLEPGTTFRWSTGALEIESTVGLLQPRRQTLLCGNAFGIVSRHLWKLRATGTSVHVHTRQSWDGEQMSVNTEGTRAVLGDSLAAWLDHLRKAAERT